MRVAIFSDFDGTITMRDCHDELVDAYIGRDRRESYDRLFREGVGTLWEVLDTSLRACNVPVEEAIRHLHAHVSLDPTFATFHAWCRSREYPLEVLSAGVDEIVRSFLAAANLEIPVTANKLASAPRGFGLDPLTPECPMGVDKGATIALARHRGAFTVFIGDGFSDRLAVPEADLVFAKSSLARFCEAKRIDYVPYAAFSDVQAHLERRFGDGV